MSARSVITVRKNCSIIKNPWFIDLIKTLQPGYDPPSRQVLSGTLLESETSCVNIHIINELSADNNFTIGEHLSNIIEEVINKVEAKKFVAIVSDNGSNVAAAHCYLYLLRIAIFFKQMPMNDYRSLKNSCIKAFNERYKEFDEDIYLLAFFLHPQYKGAGIHNTQFECIQKTALNI
ncbi:hypothetical protein RhiirC2_720104 [Rhizophagus irregularis]|uniref:DUF659 domain-containing protein n=1 Tax=Rhizophagus irregularis TaxID=588596 RepID=A0A2N1MBJ7_9GLOM|nr:hypothetical protein RhiirC2_720104 [Rhizophagus irregularis]